MEDSSQQGTQAKVVVFWILTPDLTLQFAFIIVTQTDPLLYVVWSFACILLPPFVWRYSAARACQPSYVELVLEIIDTIGICYYELWMSLCTNSISGVNDPIRMHPESKLIKQFADTLNRFAKNLYLAIGHTSIAIACSLHVYILHYLLKRHLKVKFDLTVMALYSSSRHGVRRCWWIQKNSHNYQLSNPPSSRDGFPKVSLLIATTLAQAKTLAREPLKSVTINEIAPRLLF